MRWLLVALAACAPVPAATRVASSALAGDGVTDDRAALQTALDAGPVVLPAGRYLIGPPTSGWYSLSIPGAGSLRGEPGAVLVQAPCPDGVRVLALIGAGATVADLELDGQRALQADAGEHRAGLVLYNAESATVRGVVAHDFTGDGFYVYAAPDRTSHDLTFANITARDNTRNGLTFGGGTAHVQVAGSTFTGNGGQQLDTESPLGTVDDVTITSSLLDPRGASQQYALTISGAAPGQNSKDWTVQGNVINGGINVVYGERIAIRGNRGVNPTVSPIRVYRTSRDVTIADNDFTATQATIPALGVVAVIGTAGGPPTGTRIVRNTLRVSAAIAGNGVHAEGAGDLEVADNLLIGPAVMSTIGGGVWLRATNSASPFTAAIVRRNRMVDWGLSGVQVWGNGDAALGLVDVSDNVFSSPAGTMPFALDLNFDGTGAARDVRQAGNIALGLQLVRTPGAGVWSAWGTGDRWLQ